MRRSAGRNRRIVAEILFTKQAVSDLIEESQYIYEVSGSVDTTDRFLDRMKAFIVETLAMFSKAGRPAEEFGERIRKLVYQRFSILYRIDGERIVILTIYREKLPRV